MSSPKTKRAKRIANAIHGSSFWGKAQKIWNSIATEEEKRKLLSVYCKASPAYSKIAIKLPWTALSHWTRTSLKRFFRTKEERDPIFPASAIKQKRTVGGKS